MNYAADFELWCRFNHFEQVFKTNALIGGFRRRKGQITQLFMKSYLAECEKILERERLLLSSDDETHIEEIRILEALLLSSPYSCKSRIKDRIKKLSKQNPEIKYNTNIDRYECLNPNMSTSDIFKSGTVTPARDESEGRKLIAEDNFVFSKKLNILFQQIDELKATNESFVLYGAGIVSDIVYSRMNEHVVARVDMKSALISEHIDRDVIYSVENIHNINFDRVIITVLGREHEIKTKLVDDLGVNQEHIYEFVMLC